MGGGCLLVVGPWSVMAGRGGMLCWWGRKSGRGWGVQCGIQWVCRGDACGVSSGREGRVLVWCPVGVGVGECLSGVWRVLFWYGVQWA